MTLGSTQVASVQGWQPYHVHVLKSDSLNHPGTLWASKRLVQGLLYLYLYFCMLLTTLFSYISFFFLLHALICSVSFSCLLYFAIHFCLQVICFLVSSLLHSSFFHTLFPSFIFLYRYNGCGHAAGDAAGWRIAVQVGRSRVQSPWCHNIILPAALWPWGRLSLLQKWVPGIFPGGKGGWFVGLTTLPIVLKSGSPNPLEPSWPVQTCNRIALPLRGCIQNITDWCRHLYSSCGSAKHR
jgi:hypothetical protein